MHIRLFTSLFVVLVPVGILEEESKENMANIT